MRLSNIKIKNYRLLIDAQIIDILQNMKQGGQMDEKRIRQTYQYGEEKP